MKCVLAEDCEAVDFVKVHVVLDCDGALSKLNEVQRVLFSLAASASSGSCRSALSNDNAAIPVRPRVEIQ